MVSPFLRIVQTVRACLEQRPLAQHDDGVSLYNYALWQGDAKRVNGVSNMSLSEDGLPGSREWRGLGRWGGWETNSHRYRQGTVGHHRRAAQLQPTAVRRRAGPLTPCRRCGAAGGAWRRCRVAAWQVCVAAGSRQPQASGGKGWGDRDKGMGVRGAAGYVGRGGTGAWVGGAGFSGSQPRRPSPCP